MFLIRIKFKIATLTFKA